MKRANRDLMQQVSKMDNMQKIDYLTKRSSELLADMRRLEKENQRSCGSVRGMMRTTARNLYNIEDVLFKKVRRHKYNIEDKYY